MNSHLRNQLLIGCAIGAALLALLVFLATQTEWKDIQIPRAYSGKAAQDDHYALERVLGGIGARLSRPEGIDALPPEGAVLLLSNWNWGTFPQRDRALREWVAQGGQLVAGEWAIRGNRAEGRDWIPIRFKLPASKPSKEAQAGGPAGVPQAAPFDADSFVPKPLCHSVTEPHRADDATAGDPDGEPAAAGLQMCWSSAPGLPLQVSAPAWALADAGGVRIARTTIGKGSVTIVPRLDLFDNRNLLLGDNAYIGVAVLQAHAGTPVWDVTGQDDSGMVRWLWDHAKVAIILGLGASALWLWRSIARFGPLAATAPIARRSMAEQIRGTAHFLWRQGPGVLHACQLRALQETAARRIGGYERLDLPDRAGAIARIAGMDAVELLRAFSANQDPDHRGLPRRLALLEIARRALQRAKARDHAAGSRPGPGEQQSTRRPAT
jgi:hypothetical protein